MLRNAVLPRSRDYHPGCAIALTVPDQGPREGQNQRVMPYTLGSEFAVASRSAPRGQLNVAAAKVMPRYQRQTLPRSNIVQS